MKFYPYPNVPGAFQDNVLTHHPLTMSMFRPVGRDPAATGGGTLSAIPTGRWYLRSHETHLYVHPYGGHAAQNQAVVFYSGVAEETRLMWELELSEGSDNYYIRSVENQELYWHPLGGHASYDGVPIILRPGRGGKRIRFRIQHIGDHGAFVLLSAEHPERAVHPEGGHASNNNTRLVFYSGGFGEHRIMFDVIPL
jgi:hypothetical protein